MSCANGSCDPDCMCCDLLEGHGRAIRALARHAKALKTRLADAEREAATERAAVVAFLRADAARIRKLAWTGEDDTPPKQMACALIMAARRIEAGEHRMAT